MTCVQEMATKDLTYKNTSRKPLKLLKSVIAGDQLLA